jgi:hypothetical protein
VVEKGIWRIRTVRIEGATVCEGLDIVADIKKKRLE